MITIFGNLWVNDPDKMSHLKASYQSISKIADKWVINVRGAHRDAAVKFLKGKLGRKMTLYNLQDETRGWSKNAMEMMKSIKTSHLLVWNEDHINTAPQSLYRGIAKELEQENVDAMWYSWWLFGKSRKAYQALDLKELKYIDTLELTVSKWRQINRPGYPFYVVSFLSVFKKSFFEKLLIMDSLMFPFRYTNRLYSLANRLNENGIKITRDQLFILANKLAGYRFRRFPNFTPFNLEKEQYRTDILPIKIALPKRELFASIEDDLSEPGYSLISRGLYRGKEKIRNKGINPVSW